MSRKALSMEDRILWGKVARSAVPLAGRSAGEVEPAVEDFAEMMDTSPIRRTSPVPPERPLSTAAQPQRQHGLDAPTRGKLAKGRLPIEGKVDLHGLTQSEAHTLLLSFLHRAQSDGRRHVLVVTGKGSSSGGDGVLRRAVPSWFATAPFRALVGGYEDAARRHGGGGALYVRLRRRGSP